MIALPLLSLPLLLALAPAQERSAAAPPPAPLYDLLLSTWGGGEPSTLWIADLEGTVVRRVTARTTNAQEPSASPSGRSIVFTGMSREGDRGWRLHVVGRDGRGLRRWNQDSASLERGPSWSPDGRRIAFARLFAGRTDLWTVRPDGSGLARLGPPTPDREEDGPVWSPDGRKVLYAATEGASRALWVMRADGTGARRLTRGDTADVFPGWSPDGRSVVFSRGLGEEADIVVMRADGTRPVRIRLPRGQISPAWWPNGGLIAFSSQGADGVYRAHVMRSDGTGMSPAIALPTGASVVNVRWIRRP